MKLESQNNMKLPNNVIKRTLEINSEKKKYGQIKMRDYMDRRVTSPTLFFCILLNGDVFDKKFVTRNLNTRVYVMYICLV